ncbi:pentapeptide repeat-containing protein [Teredinibacter haidensis]|uniref:pentapeptide repeat-containing protein n=1 Tax=Teredinibacter haidensis TaxID=2731755 RepID=UPI0009F94961|nr:pentapeptide repeat-containing protein [Teredinibacter haidensis]
MESITVDKKEFYNQKFVDIALTGEELKGKEFDGCSFSSCDFSEAVFRNCQFSDCKFVKCNLSLLNITNSKFSDVEFQDCKMLGIDWTKAYWRGLSLGSPLKFKDCLISSSSFYALNQSRITIENCRAHDVDFREANFSRANFSETDLTNSLFSNTNLTEANFNLATNYDINIHQNTVKNAKFCRYEAVRLLELLGIKLIG